MILINLFCCWEKVFIPMSIWMNEKNLMEQNFLKKKNFITILKCKILQCRLHAKSVCEDFETESLGKNHDLINFG